MKLLQKTGRGRTSSKRLYLALVHLDCFVYLVHVLLTRIVLCCGETLYIVQKSLGTLRCALRRLLKCKSRSSK